MTTPTTTVEAVRSMTNKEMVIAILELQAKVDELSKPKTNSSTKEMTDDDARRVIFGDLATIKHKDVADQLGLTYGQVYSCRLGFTFKNIHKECKDQGKKNQWMK